MLLRLCLAFGLLGACLLPSGAQAPPGADEWKYDVIHRKDSGPLRGLILEYGRDQITIKSIRRKPGSPTVCFTYSVSRGNVAKIEPLSVADREALKERLEALKREREQLTAQLKLLAPKGKGAKQADPTLDLRPTVWPTRAKGKALSYQSTHFHLVSNASPEVVQLAAIHLEQVYAAYERALPPRASRATPTTILLARSVPDYQAIARARGLNLLNPAFYDPARNQVVCGSDLERRRDQLEGLRRHHAKLRQDIRERRAELRKAYKGKAPAELLLPLSDADKKIRDAEQANEAAFQRAGERFFRLLYHEAFHAYLGTFVYPSRDGALPHWFNEGLAQIFETAIVEVGELRIGHPDPQRLVAVRSLLAKKNLPTLPDLLQSGPKQFFVAHASDQQVSDRYYLASWSLAFYLAFERNLLGTKRLDDYVAALNREANPLAAFRVLVDQPLDEFEKAYHAYLQPRRKGS